MLMMMMMLTAGDDTLATSIVFVRRAVQLNAGRRGAKSPKVAESANCGEEKKRR